MIKLTVEQIVKLELLCNRFELACEVEIDFDEVRVNGKVYRWGDTGMGCNAWIIVP